MQWLGFPLLSGDENITNCLAGAWGPVDCLRKSLLAPTWETNADYSPEKQRVVLRECRAAASKFSEKVHSLGQPTLTAAFSAVEKTEHSSLLQKRAGLSN